MERPRPWAFAPDSAGTLDLTTTSILTRLAGGVLTLLMSVSASHAQLLYAGGENNSTPIVLVNPATIADVPVGAAEQSGAVSGSIAIFAKTGAGNLTLSGPNTYVATTLIFEGGLIAGSDSAFGTGVLQAGGPVVTIGYLGGVTVGNRIDFLWGPGQIVNFDVAGGEATQTGEIGNPFSATLVKSGAGTLTLANANVNLSATMSVDAGALAIQNSTALGTGVVILNGGALQAGANGLDVANAVAVNTSGGTVETDGNTLTVSGDVADGNGAGALTKAGAGTLVLTGNNSYSGGTTIEGGTLSLGSDTAAGTGAITTLGSVIDYANGVVIANPIILDSDDTQLQVLTGTAEQAGDISELNGPRPLEKIGAGTLVLTGTSTYTGATHIVDGELFGDAPDALANLSDFTVDDGATLRVGDSLFTAPAIGSLAGAGSLIVGQDSELTIGLTGNDATFSGIVSGLGGLFKDGTGTQTLTGLGSTLGQDLFVGDGALHLDGASITVGGGVAVQDGTLRVTNGADLTAVDPFRGVGIGGSMIVDGAGTSVTTDGLTDIISLPFGGPASLTVSSGAVFNSNGGAIVDDATVTVTGAGSQWNIDNDLLVGCFCSPSTLTVADGAIVTSTGDTVIESGSTLNLGLGGLAGSIVTDEIENEGAVNANFTDTLTLAADITGAGTLTKSGAGTLVLTGDNTYGGGTTVAGGTLSLGSDTAAGTGAITTLGSVIDYANGVVIANPIVINSNTTELQVLTGTAEQAGDISELNGPRPLGKIGAGTLVLSGANTYTGPTTILEGSLLAATDTALSEGSAFRVNDGAGLLLADGVDAAIASLADGPDGGGTVVLGLVDLGSPAVNSYLAVGLDDTNTTFSGVITGVGSLEKTGAGTLTLTGDSTIGGDLILCDCNGSGGLAIAGGSFSAGGSVEVTDSTLSITLGGILRQADPTGFLGIDAGTVLVDGAGSEVTAAGAALLSGSALTISNGGNVEAAVLVATESSFSVVSGGVLEQTDASFGFIFDSGALTVDGTGSKVVVNGGTQITGSFDPVSVTVSNGAVFDSLGGAEISGFTGGPGLPAQTATATVTGSGSIWNVDDDLLVGCFCGPATLNIADGGVVNSTGDTVIALGSTLNLGLGGLAGSIVAEEIANEGAINANFTDTLTLAADITGAGALTKSGAGTLVLTGDSSYSGGTTLAGGTLSLGTSTAAGTGAITTLGSVIDYANGVVIANPIVVNSDTTQLQVLAGTAEQAGAISELNGPRPLQKIGAGTLVLSGANTYTGGTVISAGALQANGNDAVGTGTVTLDGGAFRAGADDLNFSNAFAINTTGGTIDTNFRDLTISGAIGNGDGTTGGLNVVGVGTLILLGNNTYTGGTTISGNALLQLGDAGDMGSIVGAVVNNAGFVITNADTSGITNITNQGVGGLISETIFLDGTTASSATIVNNDDSATSFVDTSTAGNATIINNADGFAQFFDTSTAGGASITNQGAGGEVGQTVFRDSSTAGDATITNGAGGITHFRDSTTAGNATIANNDLGTTNFSDASTADHAVITDDDGFMQFFDTSTAANATITNSGSGTTTFGGKLFFWDTSTAADATIVNNAFGATQFNDSSTAANATITTNAGGFTYFTDSSTGGNARFITNAGGKLDMSFLNSGAMTAGSIEGAGTYFLGSAFLTVGSNNRSTEVSGVIADGGENGGTGGGLDKVGAGTLILTGANTYTGGTTISGGTLQLGNGGTSGSVLGNIVDNATLAIERSDTFTVGNLISGTGAFEQNGTGTTILTANNTYTGPTTVNGGILSVNGSIVSAVTVNDGATLGGTGAVGTTLLNDGAALGPGNSVGLLTVANSLTFGGGSKYLVEVGATGADRTNVVAGSGGTGTATLSGGAVEADFVSLGSLQKRYTILNAAGGLGGTTFTGVTDNAPGVVTSLFYDANNVYLDNRLALSELPGLTINQKSVAAALEDYFSENGALPLAFATLDADGLTTAAGELGTGAIQSGFEASDRFLDVISDRFVLADGGNAGAAPSAYAEQAAPSGAYAALIDKKSEHALAGTSDGRWKSWGAAYGGLADVDGDEAVVGSHDLDTDVYGFAAGAGWRQGDVAFGAALGGGRSSFDLDGGLGSGDAGLFNAGIYGRAEFGEAYLAGALAYGYHDVSTSRTAFGDTLEANYGAHSFSGRAEAGYRFDTALAGLTPYLAFQGTSLSVPSYSETASGAGTFALDYDGRTATAARGELGLRLDKAIVLDETALLKLTGRAAWAHSSDNDRDIVATFQTLPGATFTVIGAEAGRDSALVDLGAELAWQNGLSASLAFQGQFGDGYQSYSGSVKLGFAW
jgi:autotransporter-associated beta strand protein/T5SS/PEP-CTERM-associated repeat protein